MITGGLSGYPKHCGGSLDWTEIWLKNIKSAMGDAFSTDDNNTIVGIERIALADFLARISRAGERFYKNYSQPATAWELLRWWAKILDVPIRATDTAESLRLALKAKYLLSQGNSYNQVKTALQVLLGGAFVDLLVNVGSDLDNPPEPTISGTQSTPDHDLGNGDWYTSRSHVLVLVQTTATQNIEAIQQLCNDRVLELLNRIMPAYSTFGYAFNSCFELDVDPLDLTALC